MIWWHKHILRHKVTKSRVTIPLWASILDRGILYKCECGKDWAR